MSLLNEGNLHFNLFAHHCKLYVFGFRRQKGLCLGLCVCGSEYFNCALRKTYSINLKYSPVPSPPQVWWTGRCWSRWSGATACPAPRAAPSRCTSWWRSAGRRTRTRGPRSSTCSPSWRITSPPRSHSISRGRTYSLGGDGTRNLLTLRGSRLESGRISRTNHYSTTPLLHYSFCFQPWFWSLGEFVDFPCRFIHRVWNGQTSPSALFYIYTQLMNIVLCRCEISCDNAS